MTLTKIFISLKSVFNYLIIPIIFLSCNHQEKPSGDQQKCDPSLANNLSPNKHLIFKPCRQFIYSASIWDEKYNLLSRTKVRLTPTGKDWEQQPERQSELAVHFTFKEEEETSSEPFYFQTDIAVSSPQQNGRQDLKQLPLQTRNYTDDEEIYVNNDPFESPVEENGPYAYSTVNKAWITPEENNDEDDDHSETDFNSFTIV